MEAILNKIREELISNSDEKTKLSGERFFKETVSMYGVRTAKVTQIGNEVFRDIKSLHKEEIFNLCEELWKSGMMEESFVACNWSHKLNRSFKPSDFRIFESWVFNYISNWASCDTFCNHTIGTFIVMYPDYLDELKKWAHSENRWVKRASSVSLIVPARKGKFLKEIFEIADILHTDKDDMVQKGYGWMLKSASQASQQEVFMYVMRKKDTMPRTALRYAIEKMPADLKTKAMAR